MTYEIDRLFSSVVLVGLATGCGGLATGQDDETGAGGREAAPAGGAPGPGAASGGGPSPSGGAASVGGPGVTPESCASPAQYRCDAGDCFCDPNAPSSSADCKFPSTFVCEGAFCPAGGICVISDPSQNNLSCSCDPERPTGPHDCADPAEFICAVPAGWECSCQPGAPRTPEDCADPVTFSCQALSPPQGCSCTGISSADAESCSARTGRLLCQSEEPRFGCECRILAIR